MEHYGIWSILPPIVAIALAIKTKQVYLSLGIFIWFGWTIMSGGNPLTGLIQSVDVFVESVTSPGNARTLLFSALIGAVITFTQVSGGMEGFIEWVERSRIATTKRAVELLATFVSLGVFLESNFGLLVSGSVARPLFDKYGISRERLSYIIDATCAPKCVLIPINAWGAYIVSLLIAQDVENPIGLVISALALNFYAWIAILTVFFMIFTGKNIGPMREAERRVREEGKLLRDGAVPLVSKEVSALESKEGIPKRAINMVAPIVTMVATVPIVLWLTGSAAAGTTATGFMETIGAVINRALAGDGSTAVLWGVIVGLFVGAGLYMGQGILDIKEITDNVIRGIQGLTPLVIVLALAFTIGATQRALGTGLFLAQAASDTVPAGFIPAIIFVLACIMAFSTGTSWGTFAIMIPIVIPMAEVLDLHTGLALAAAIGGGIFGDHCSPISDSTIVASMAAATDHIDHVRTQIPYALISAVGAVTLFVIAGFVL